MKFKYIETLAKSGLKIEELSKGIQSKIKYLTEVSEKISNVEVENLDAGQKQDYEDLLSEISQLDSELERAILKFNPDTYKKRLEVINNARDKKDKKPNSSEKPILKTVPPPVQHDTANNYNGVGLYSKQQPETNIATVTQPVVDKKVDELKKDVEVHPEQFQEMKQEQQVEVIADEFDKKGEVKQKKMTLGFVLVGIGALALTAGMFNIFKERK